MRIFAAAAALFLTGCYTPCPAVNADATVSNFTCEDGSALRVTFTPTQATVEQEGYVTLSLPARTSGGAYRYSANGVELRGRAARAQWTRPGAAETLCSIDQ